MTDSMKTTKTTNEGGYEYVAVVTVMVRGLTPVGGIDFAEDVADFVRNVVGSEENYFIELSHGVYDPELVADDEAEDGAEDTEEGS